MCASCFWSVLPLHTYIGGEKGHSRDGEPVFDKGRFATTAGPLERQLARPKGASGALLPATWEGGNRSNPSPTVTGKIGKDKSYEALVRKSIQPWRQRQNYNWKDEPEPKARKFAARIQAARSSYYDLCDHLKCTCAADQRRQANSAEDINPNSWVDTYAQAAIAQAEDAIRRDSAISPGKDWTQPPATKPAQTYREGRYWTILDTSPGEITSFPAEMVSAEARKRSRDNDQRRKSKQQTRFLGEEEELQLMRKAKAGDLPSRHRIIVAHLPLVKSLAKKWHAKWVTDDLIQEGIFGLNKAIDGFDPELGYRFADYARTVVNNVLVDYLREQRDLRRGDRLAEHADEETAALAIFHDELPSLDCLTIRQRDIIEKRYLSGGARPLERRVIGAELCISAERVRQIELTALAKLKKIGQACIT